MFEFDQDVVFTELMLYAPMNILEQIAEAQRESILADMQEEDAEIFREFVPVQSEHKPSAKQRRARRRVQNKRHKAADRLHGKGTYVYHYKENGELKEAISSAVRTT